MLLQPTTQHFSVDLSGAVAPTDGLDPDAVARHIDASAEDCMQRQSTPASMEEEQLSSASASIGSTSSQPQGDPKAADRGSPKWQYYL